ncbi:MAG: gamma-glutamyl-gamma-aminobutyrate hydrolase family protein, partial [Actinomycetota bacterium]
KRDLPVLAICRGFQLLNVGLGGTLDQNLGDEGERMDHDRDMPRAEPVHNVKIEEGCYLAEILGGTHVPVNSHHHQGLDRLAAELRPVAWATDGILEAVISTEHTWVVGVQWHPEVMAPLDQRQMRLFEEFIAATERYAAESDAA